ncbi:TPA: ead/Ea22-like family protein [Escherichia coli]|nr:ead/Ea22-like family protein [Escherichia coli]
MSEIDYQALREKAEKATCGVWSLEYGEGRFDGDDALIHREVAGYIPICRIEGAHPESGFDEDFQIEQQANAEFIAAANPATVLALLEELETAKKCIAELEAEPVSNHEELPLDYLQGQKDGLEWAAQLAEANHPQTGDWLYDDPLELAKAIRKGPDMPEFDGPTPVTPDGWISCSERMPEDTKMLLAFSQGEIVAAYWNWVVNPIDYKKYRAFTYLSGNILDDVTHWMPLPEPPQEVK